MAGTRCPADVNERKAAMADTVELPPVVPAPGEPAPWLYWVCGMAVVSTFVASLAALVARGTA